MGKELVLGKATFVLLDGVSLCFPEKLYFAIAIKHTALPFWQYSGGKGLSHMMSQVNPHMSQVNSEVSRSTSV